MTFWKHFRLVLRRRPRQALAALYWQVTRRKVRARNRLRVASVNLPIAYAVWISTNENDAEAAAKPAIDERQWAPRFLVLLHGNENSSADRVDRSIASFEQQAYDGKTLTFVTAKPIRDAVAETNADYVILLRVGDALARTALSHWSKAIQSNEGAEILYGDQDQLDARGQRSRPWFKPRWNKEMFLAQDYLAAAVAIKARLAVTAAENSTNMSELQFRAALESKQPPIHVPHIMCHVDASADDTSERLATVANYVRSVGASCQPGPFGTAKIDWPLPSHSPPVSIIIPTKDKVELLHPCLEGLLQRTDYDNFEILVVDNASTESRTANFLASVAEHPQVRVLQYAAPYNFSAINNFAVRHANGTHLCLLNNDTQVVEPTWLREMMRYAVRADVGAVGAKLLYEDGSIQHAGVVIGIGEAAGHAHRFLPDGDPGYFRQAHVAQFVSAVTAACLLVEKRKFLAVGGLDEVDLAVAFNDVDLCLKLEKAGWRNIYTPHAVLVHHESKSRGKDSSPENIQRYRRELAVLQERWNTKTYDDPLHNPNLDRYTETFAIRL